MTAAERCGTRARLLAVAEEHMVSEMGLANADAAYRVAMLRPEAVLPVEFAHTPQLPHLGVVRMLLTARDRAVEQDGVFLYAVNDHLPARLLPESRYVPVTTDAGPVAKPPRFGPGKKAKGGMHREPPPGEQVLVELEASLAALLPRHRDKATSLGEHLRTVAASTSSLAAWLVRVQLELLGLRPVVLPASRLAEALPGLADRYFEQRPEGRWALCGRCGVRAQTAGAHACAGCGAPAEVQERVPDVVGRQVLTNALGLGLRVCGRDKPYQVVADEMTVRLQGSAAPTRYRVTGSSSLVRCRAHVDRANLVQVLLEGVSASSFAVPDDPRADWELTA